MQIIEDKKSIENPLFLIMYNKWQDLGAGPIPHIDMLTKSFLDDMAGFSKIVQKTDDGRFLYVTAGAAFEKIYQEIAGKYLDEVYPDWIRKDTKDCYELCLESQKPVYNRKKFATVAGEAGYEFLLFPFLSEDNEPPDYILSCVSPLHVDSEKFKDLNEIIEKTPWF